MAEVDTGDFFTSPFGNLRGRTWRSRRTGKLLDLAFASRLKMNRSFEELKAASKSMKPQRVLIVGIEAPSRPGDIHKVIRDLSKTRHAVEVTVIPMENRGKFENLNLALSMQPNLDFDWIMFTDDDIVVPDGFLDYSLLMAQLTDLRLFQPAHKFRSFAAFILSHAHWNSLVRLTHFVEIGPLTALHRSTFDSLLPFPATKMGYGLDLVWSDIARSARWNIGFIDALPIEHLRPIAATYKREQAIEEARLLMRQHGVTRPKQDFLKTVRKFLKIELDPKNNANHC